MTFLSPALLWSLCALVPLAAIYFLKVRPRRKPTTAYFLWQRVFQERSASSLFHRLRDAWSLALMALAATAVCLALARPEWADKRLDLIIVIDNSASMSAREGRLTRLEQAKRLAGDVVQGLNGNQRAAIATASQQLRYHSHLTNNPRELLEAIEGIASSAESLDMRILQAATWQTSTSHAPQSSNESPASKLSTPITSVQTDRLAGSEYRVLLLTDGSFDTNKLPKHIELLKVGTPLDNVGLIASDMQFLGGDTTRVGFYYQVASTFKTPKKVDLSLYSIDEAGQESLQKVIPLAISPGINQPETFELSNAPVGRWIARLELNDALFADNTVYLSLPKPNSIRVAVESTDRFFLENSVHAFSRGENVLELSEKDPQVILAKSQTPNRNSTIIFQPAGNSIWWTELGDELAPGAARVLIEGHPVLRYVDVSSIPFIGARKITPIAGAQVLVATDGGTPLIYQARHGEQSAVVVNIDPVAAEFYFSAWFPVLVHSAVTHLVGHDDALPAAHRSGDPIPIPGGRDDVTTKITGPVVASGNGEGLSRPASEIISNGSNSAKTQSSNDDSTRAITGDAFREADGIGFYALENPSGKYIVGSSLLSAAETLLNNESTESAHEPLSRGRSPAAWLTVLAIIALTAESILYHRRKVG